MARYRVIISGGNQNELMAACEKCLMYFGRGEIKSRGSVVWTNGGAERVTTFDDSLEEDDIRNKIERAIDGLLLTLV